MIGGEQRTVRQETLYALERRYDFLSYRLDGWSAWRVRRPVFCDIAAMYRETGADVVVVAANELSMRDRCLACFSHPWVCLREAVGSNLVEVRNIQTAVAAADVVAFIAPNRRSYSATRQALIRLDGDDTPHLIGVLDQQDLIAVRDGGQPEYVLRNYMYANSLHLIDYFHVLRRGERHLSDGAIDREFRPGLHHQAEQLVRFLREGRIELASLQDATRSVELCADIYGLRA